MIGIIEKHTLFRHTVVWVLSGMLSLMLLSMVLLILYVVV